jgi:succinate dehydrogenase/fumarate reductase flavoprotein subunit
MLKAVGLGAAAMAVPGLGMNAGAAPMTHTKQEVIETDVLVVGGGFAGTFAALKAREQGVDVTMAINGDGAGKKVYDMGVNLLERVRVADLLLDGSRAVGAVCHTSKEDKEITIKAKSVVFATEAGGYKPNGFPLSSLTFDGIGMVYKHGILLSAPEAMPSRKNRPAVKDEKSLSLA